MDSLKSGATPWTELEELIERADSRAIKLFLDELSSLDAALVVSRLDDEQRARLLTLVEPGHAATVVDQIPEDQAVDAMEQLDPHVAAAILHEMPADDRADLLADMDDPAAEAILGAMDQAEAADTRSLRKYPEDVAGGIMTLEFLSYPETASAARVIHDLRVHAEKYRDFVVQYVFVVSRSNQLVGVLRLRDLLFAEEHQRIRDLMLAAPLSIPDSASLDEVREFFEGNSLFGVPVVDARGHLVGLIRRTAIAEALADRSDAAFLKTQGIVGGEELRTMPVLQRAWRRLSWLSANIVLNIIAASVIALYQDTLTAVIALAVFLPIISDMSGCSGNQAVAVSMRELSLGLLRPSEVRRVWLKEISVGLLNGIALGTLIATVAWAWKGNPFLGLVVGGALMINTVVAVSIGGTIPLLLRRLGLDPALASGPILTTVTDMCGFFLLLSMAHALLPRLLAG